MQVRCEGAREGRASRFQLRLLARKKKGSHQALAHSAGGLVARKQTLARDDHLARGLAELGGVFAVICGRERASRCQREGSRSQQNVREMHASGGRFGGPARVCSQTGAALGVAITTEARVGAGARSDEGAKLKMAATTYSIVSGCG